MRKTAHALRRGDGFMRERLIKGGIWAVLSRVVAIGLGLIFNVLLARMLSPSEMGTFFLALSLTGIFSVFGAMGLPQVVVRLVAESISVGLTGRAKQSIQRATLLALAGGVVIALSFYLGVGDLLASQVLHSNGLHLIIGLIALSIVVNSVQGVVGETYRGFHDIRAASIIASVLPQAIVVVFLALLWSNGVHANLQLIFGMTLASSVVTLFAAGAFLRKRVSDLRGTGTAAYGELVSIGWPLCLSQVAIFSANQADLWIVGAFLSEQDVAIYGSVQKLLILMTMTHSLVAAVAQSSVAELYARGEKQKLERMIQGMAFVACVPSGLLLLAFAFFGADILRLVFGEFYHIGSVPLLILGAGHFFGMLLGPAGMVLTMAGQQKQAMLIIMVTSLVTIVMAVMFTRPFGVTGVAVAWSIGAAMYGLGTWMSAYRTLGVKTHVRYLPDMLAWRRR